MGISNCDTVRKARDWLNTQGISHEFQDFKKFPPTPVQVDQWLAQIPWETLINRKGILWRRLTAPEQAAITDAKQAKNLALKTPGIVKRPVVQWPNGQITVGFVPATWQALANPTSCYQSKV
jgi:Spx/MgsR family transcriptional regulator